MKKQSQKHIVHIWILACSVFAFILVFWIFQLKNNFETIKTNKNLISITDITQDILKNIHVKTIKQL